MYNQARTFITGLLESLMIASSTPRIEDTIMAITVRTRVSTTPLRICGLKMNSAIVACWIFVFSHSETARQRNNARRTPATTQRHGCRNGTATTSSGSTAGDATSGDGERDVIETCDMPITTPG